METENNINNGVTPNQQPQPQKEEEKKKKNKFVAWWLGLNKWAKVGICAGTAAVLATAITLPIVLTKGGGSKGETYALDSYDGGTGFTTENYVNLKKDVEYTFTCKIADHGLTATSFHVPLEEGQAVMSEAKLFKKDGSDSGWTLVYDNTMLSGDSIEDPESLTIKAKFANNYDKVKPFLNTSK